MIAIAVVIIRNFLPLCATRKRGYNKLTTVVVIIVLYSNNYLQNKILPPCLPPCTKKLRKRNKKIIHPLEKNLTENTKINSFSPYNKINLALLIIFALTQPVDATRAYSSLLTYKFTLVLLPFLLSVVPFENITGITKPIIHIRKNHERKEEREREKNYYSG